MGEPKLLSKVLHCCALVTLYGPVTMSTRCTRREQKARLDETQLASVVKHSRPSYKF